MCILTDYVRWSCENSINRLIGAGGRSIDPPIPGQNIVGEHVPLVQVWNIVRETDSSPVGIGTILPYQYVVGQYHTIYWYDSIMYDTASVRWISMLLYEATTTSQIAALETRWKEIALIDSILSLCRGDSSMVRWSMGAQSMTMW